MESYSYVPKALFDGDLDAITLAHVKSVVGDPTGSLAVRLRQLPQSLSDAIMFAPKLVVKVTGDNAPLAALVQIFGADAIEELLRGGDLEFILWRDSVAVTWGVPNAIPFVGIAPNMPEWSDPEASNAAGLERASSLSGLERRRLTALATERTSLTNPKKPILVIQALEEAHKAGELSRFGFPPEVSFTTATDEQKKQLIPDLGNLQLASELVDREIDLHESVGAWDAMLSLSTQVNSSSQVLQVAQALMKEERVPSVGRLVARKVLSPREAVKLRQTSEARAFREWLWTRPDPSNAEAVLRGYRRVIARDRKDLNGKWWYRTLRVLGIEAAVRVVEPAVTLHSLGATIAARTVLPIAAELWQLAKEKRSPRRLSRLLKDVEQERAGPESTDHIVR